MASHVHWLLKCEALFITVICLYQVPQYFFWNDVLQNMKHFKQDLMNGEHTLICSYLMRVQTIDQNSFPEVLGKTKVFYCSRSFTSGNRTLWSFQIPREKYFDLLPALPLNNWIMSTFDGRGIPWVYTALKLNFTKKFYVKFMYVSIVDLLKIIFLPTVWYLFVLDLFPILDDYVEFWSLRP